MMSSIRRIGMAGALLAASTILIYDLDAAEPAPGPPIDVSRPASWDAAATELKRQENALVQALISVATDEKRRTDDRRKAVFAMSHLRNKRSLDFLIGNVSLRLPEFYSSGDRELRQTPCAYVLAERRRFGDTPALALPGLGETGATPTLRYEWGREWATAKAIILGLDGQERSRRDVMMLGYAIERELGIDFARSAVDDALKTRVPPAGPWRKNLTAIKTYLERR